MTGNSEVFHMADKRQPDMSGYATHQEILPASLDKAFAHLYSVMAAVAPPQQEFSMQATMQRQTFRGVACLHCDVPIRLPSSILQRAISFDQSEQDPIQQWCSKVFSHRCRICGEEAIYLLNHFLDFEDKNPA
jgi:hypothetical protein